MHRVLLYALIAFNAAAYGQQVAGTRPLSEKFLITSEQALSASYDRVILPFFQARATPRFFPGKDRISIAYAVFRDEGVRNTDRDAIVFVTGRADSYVKYPELIHDLYRNGYAVYIYDHRGQGFSERLLKGAEDRDKGYVEHFEDYVADLDIFIKSIVLEARHRRVFLIAHSMGGTVSALWAEGKPKGIDALVLSSPMLEPNVRGYANGVIGLFGAQSRDEMNAIVGRLTCSTIIPLLGKLAPTAFAAGAQYPLEKDKFQGNPYTHSAIRFEKFVDAFQKNRAALLEGATWHWVEEACKASASAVRNASDIKLPVLVLQAGADRYVEPHAQREFCDNLVKGGNRTCETGGVLVVDGARHEMMIESDRYRTPALSAILQFLARER